MPFPSSIGLSFLLLDSVQTLSATATWGDYYPEANPTATENLEETPEDQLTDQLQREDQKTKKTIVSVAPNH